MSLTGRISARTPQTTEVSPIRTRADPLACVREDVLREMGRHWFGVRFEGRRTGSRERWAWSNADGKIRGIVDAGMDVSVLRNLVVVVAMGELHVEAVIAKPL